MLADAFAESTTQNSSELLVWSVRVALVCYLTRISLRLSRGDRWSVPSTAECVWWSAGCACYLLHVYCAFSEVHDWSHAEAWTHTARETARLTGWSRGEGLWVNYLFTLMWVADVVRMWREQSLGTLSPKWLRLFIHGCFAFVVINATIVFGPDLYRYLALPIGLGLLFVSRWNRSTVGAAKAADSA